MTSSVKFDKLAAHYDAARGGEGRGHMTAATISPHLAPGPVLEVGVGTGVVAAGLAALGRTVRGVDVSQPMLDVAAKRFDGELLIGDGMALPFDDASQDNVVYVHALHLMADMTAVLTEAARVLRPGGRVVIRHGDPVADADDLVLILRQVQAMQPARPDEPDAVRAAAEAAGLRLLRQGLEPEYESGMNPDTFIALITNRQVPFLQRLEPEQAAEVVAPILEQLRALPEPQRVRRQAWSCWLTAAEKPV
ncbi:class I SAM-dependent methyltransferase [Streptomyces sp. NBRC 110035]|uniref:class I SAM-dependent methyltransferase n=1 Tax=Streptomyces sp. NBRC 110035 TaxID=1547867 RepID=UPI0005AAC156|nr:class I SAM-dependent methyltransferase [Streptomyces sp. NBRC 110035]